jgi:sarcosine oxidase subunit gamma
MEGASVPDLVWNAVSPLAGVLVAGRHGAPAGRAGVALAELGDFSLVQVMARRGRWAQAAEIARARFGIAPPARPSAVFGKKAVLVWSGPDQFLALADRGTGPSFGDLKEAFAGAASLSDQSDGRCLIRLSGTHVREALAKLSSLDLHDTAFPAGSAAATFIDHTNVSLWRGPDGAEGAAFDLLVFTSFASSLWRTILDAAAEYGVEAGSGPAFP